ncbi:MAG: DUF58 domain-containing protein [Verrucomicrobiales bacterium]
MATRRPISLSTRWFYRNYRFSSSIKYWVRRTFTPGGVLLVGAMIMCAGLGLDTNQAMAYQAFSFLAFALLISVIWSFFPRPKLSATRTLPKLGSVGQPLIYTLTAKNPTKKQQANVSVWEDLGDPRPTLEQFATTPEPGEHRRNAFDRLFRFYRWNWLIAQNEIAKTFEAVLPTLAPDQTVEAKIKVVPQKRGILRFTGFTFAIPDPFGLCRAFSKYACSQQILVLPKRYLLGDFNLPGQLQHQPGGVNLASSIGESEEFVALREYRRGDPMRHIHWKSVSKTGKLIVKEFQNEFFVRHALILDTFLGYSETQKFEEAVSVAASFAWSLHTQESLLDLVFIGPEAYCFTAGRGVGHVEQMLEILASVGPCTTRTFESLDTVVIQRINLVSGCICILLEWDDARKKLIEKMLIYGVPLKVFVVVEPGTAPLDPGPVNPADFYQLEVGKIQEGLAKI